MEQAIKNPSCAGQVVEKMDLKAAFWGLGGLAYFRSTKHKN